jgi:hypothetical protein
MRRILPLLLSICLAVSACSEAVPPKQEIQLPVASLPAKATIPLFQLPLDTPTPIAGIEQDFSFTVTLTVSLTATQTLTPTQTANPILITPGLPTQPPVLLTPAPKNPQFLKKDKGEDPCT